VTNISDAPIELQVAIREFWPESEWDNAAGISWLESEWNAFAEADTTDSTHPCGSTLRYEGGQRIAAERSIGYFQINVCNLPSNWNPCHLYNARHNAGTAHDLWAGRRWLPWYFSAQKLGLL